MASRDERLRYQLVAGLLKRLHLEALARRYNRRFVMAAFTFINGGISIALISFVALITQEAFIFPSLGATAFIIYYVPLSSAASPRNVFWGHLIGASCGLLALYLFALHQSGSAVYDGVTLARVGAIALSLSLAGFLMIYFEVAHPPAAATALIVSLGLMPDPRQIPVLMAGVVLLLIQAFLMNRLSGINYPAWKSKARHKNRPFLS